MLFPYFVRNTKLPENVHMNRNTSVSGSLHAGRRGSIPCRVWDFSPFHICVLTGFENHPPSYPTDIRSSFPGVKLPEREVDSSSPSSAEVKE